MLQPIARMLVVVQTMALVFGTMGAATLLWTASKFNTASDWVEHAHEVVDQINAVRTELLRGNLALRNYAISPDPGSLEQAYSAAKTVTKTAERLEDLVQDNPTQSSRAFALRAEAAEMAGWMRGTALIAERDGPAALLAILAPRISQDSAKTLRQQLMEMEVEERSLLLLRTQDRALEYKRLVMGSAVVGAAFIFLLAWSMTYATALFRRSTRRIKTLSESADCDPLTGLLNRRALEERFGKLVDTPLTVVALDLDEFKPVNDSYGHQAGDEVLIATAQRLLHECRDEDLVARAGGDEFVVILTGVSDAASARSFSVRAFAARVGRAHPPAGCDGQGQGIPRLRSLSRRHLLERIACESRCGSLCGEISSQRQDSGRGRPVNAGMAAHGTRWGGVLDKHAATSESETWTDAGGHEKAA